MRLNLACVRPGRGCALGVVGCCCVHAVTCACFVCVLAEVAWDGAPERVRAPVREGMCASGCGVPSSSGLVESAVNLPGPPGKPKYSV